MKISLALATIVALSVDCADADAVPAYHLFMTKTQCGHTTYTEKGYYPHESTQKDVVDNCAKDCCEAGFPWFTEGHKTCFCYPQASCEGTQTGYGGTGLVGADAFTLYKCGAGGGASSGGDPHFTTFGGKKYDFHGGCDLVLVSNPDFDHGKGLFVHGRTEVEDAWSRIDTAAVQLGENTLEIKAGLKQITYWLDGVEVSDMETGDASLGDHAIRFKRINDHQSQTRVDLGFGNALSIETLKRFVRVNVKVAAGDEFVGTYGLYGSYPGGDLLGRDKTTVFEDTDEFGFEWQVHATDPQIFHNAGPIQHPMKCAMPDMTKKSQARRRLGEAAITEEDAALACAHVNEHDKDACIFDVLATNDKDMAGSY